MKIINDLLIPRYLRLFRSPINRDNTLDDWSKLGFNHDGKTNIRIIIPIIIE